VPWLFKQDESAGIYCVIEKSAVTFLKDESAGTYSVIEKSAGTF
jgi:hypothetical protein